MDGILPKGYLALPEQYLDGGSPDVLTLQSAVDMDFGKGGFSGPAIQTSKSNTYHHIRQEDDHYLSKQKRIVVRDRKKRRIAAVIEIFSPSTRSY